MKSANEMQNVPLLENLANYRICHAKGFFSLECDMIKAMQ